MKEITICVNGRNEAYQNQVLLSEIIKDEKPCGGHGKCGKCKVIAGGALSAPGEAEQSLLTKEELEKGVRLACLTHAIGDCWVKSFPKEENMQIVTGGNGVVSERNPLFLKYGVAIDIGTTTLAGRLYDGSGKLLAEIGCKNPQSVWGADVISRVEAALDDSKPLTDAIQKEIDSLISRLAAKASVSCRDIDGAAITGNTVMLHLFTGTDVEPLSHAPFDVKRLFGEVCSAGELGLKSVPEHTEVYIPLCVSAFVGADVASALIAERIWESEKSHVLADIGTNGEIALWHDKKLYVCSTAAGPAFEGVGISMGMQGAVGAIDRVYFENGKPEVHVIGDAEACGICGSGIVDAVAWMLKENIVDETGYLEDESYELLSPVCITQNDIRAVQLAKSAIHAGIRTLVRYAGISCDKIDSFSVAGGFGHYLDMKNAVSIGLFPEEFENCVKVIGNAALDGVSMLLLDKKLRDTYVKYMKDATVVELSSNPVFSSEYIEQMMFPSV